MIVGFLDLHTGRRALRTGISRFELCEGNWSCDCNRALAFGNDLPEGYCVGAKRYVAIQLNAENRAETHFDHIEVLKEANSRYLCNGGLIEPLVRYPIPDTSPPHSNPVYTDLGLWCYQNERGWIPAPIRWSDGIFVTKDKPKWWALVPHDEVDWEEET